MKRIMACIIFTASTALAAPLSAETFSPALLKIIAPEVIEYDFSSTDLEIPMEITGTPAQIVFCVFTKDRASTIGPSTNGYLGWHYVNRIDTCVYYKHGQSLEPGTHTIVWDSRDNDGKYVEPGTYTYYIWGFDNQSPRQKVTHFITPSEGNMPGVIETDAEGLPLANPILYSQRLRWPLGSAPMDASFVEMIDYPDTSSWGWIGTPAVVNGFADRFYVRVRNHEEMTGAIAGYRWIPDGVPEPLSGFGEGGRTASFDDPPGREPGVVTDGEYMYTTDGANTQTLFPFADFYMFDINGSPVCEIDLTDWWSSTEVPQDSTAFIVNGGPSNISQRNGMVYLNSHASCLQQMVDPVGYLESGNPKDFFVWTNGNGDYAMDKNFAETSEQLWLCNDDNYELYYQLFADGNGFVHGGCYDIGAVSFGLMAPDGTGLWYFAFQGEDAGVKYGVFLVNGGTAFDGIYSENLYHFSRYKTAGTEAYVVINGQEYETRSIGTYFSAHDSFRGTIEPADEYIVIFSPIGGETVTGGLPLEIQWSARGADEVKIEWSGDDTNWETIAERIDAAAGSCTWDVPLVSTNGRIRISALDNEELVTVSRETFTIIPLSVRMYTPKADTRCLDGQTIRIEWNQYGIDRLILEYSLDGGDTWQTIATGVEAVDFDYDPSGRRGYYTWDPPDVDAPDCRVRLTAENNPEVTAVTDGVFSLAFHALRILLPNSNTKWTAGEEQKIMWEAEDITAIDILYTTDDGITWALLASDIPAAPEEYYIQAPESPSGECIIRLAAGESGPTATSRSFILTGGMDVVQNTPATFSVAANSPNPFNAMTVIPFTIPESGAVKAEVFSLTGQRVETLADDIFEPGHHLLTWDAGQYSAGIYFCRITWRSRSLTCKLMLVK